jgi:K+-sensing histidine kinase KdpD
MQNPPVTQNRPTLSITLTRGRQLRGYAWGMAAPFICTLINWPLQNVLGEASILMIYLLGVFLVANHFGRGASMLASLLSAPLFAFYFARPIFSVAISDLENIVGLGVMIVVANLTSNLQDKARACRPNLPGSGRAVPTPLVQVKPDVRKPAAPGGRVRRRRAAYLRSIRRYVSHVVC